MTNISGRGKQNFEKVLHYQQKDTTGTRGKKIETSVPETMVSKTNGISIDSKYKA